MKDFKYLLIALLSVLFIHADADYNPTNPPEPGGCVITTRAVPAGAGYTSQSSATLKPGESTTIYAYSYSGYSFEKWEDADGNTVSTSNALTVTYADSNASYNAVFRFNPSNPSEPTQPETYVQVNASPSPSAGGYTYGSGKYKVGQTINVTAYSYSNYYFVNWTRNGEVISESYSFNYVVEESGNDLVANFKFNPSNPGEPQSPAQKVKIFTRSFPSSGGGLSIKNGEQFEPGSTIYVYAYESTGYQFQSFTDEKGNVLSYWPQFDYTVPETDSYIYANFEYNPSNPGEPGASTPKRNIIYGAREVVMPGGTTIFTISLENKDEIVGMNVDVSLPANLNLSLGEVSLSSRCGAHSMMMLPVDATTGRVMVTGTEPFAGANGPILRLPVTAPADAVPGTTITVPLSHGVIYLADGSQTTVDVVDGRIQIAELPETLPDSPDFIVTDITADNVSIMPGDLVTLNWKVENIGLETGASGWTEIIYLINEEGRRASIGRVSFDCDELAPGASVTRSATVLIDKLPGISGRVNVGISLVPNALSGEIEQRQANNNAVGSGFPIHLGKVLSLSLPESATEGTDSAIKGYLARSGNWDSSETFTLRIDDEDDRLSVPAELVIPKNQSGAYFTVRFSNDSELQMDKSVTIAAEGNGYQAVEASMMLIDDELPEITMEMPEGELSEGSDFEIVLKLSAVPTEDVDVAISVSKSGRVTLPEKVTVPAGSSQLTIKGKVVDNNTIDGDAMIYIIAQAAGYINADEDITVIDNDIPTLSMSISPTEVSEGDGPAAISGVLSRTDNFDKRVTVVLSDNANGQLMYPQQRIVMEKGVKAVEFSIGVLDNNIVDGDRDVEITAAVYISSCSCTATGKNGGEVKTTVSIIDNDGPSLALSADKTVLAENDPDGIRLTVTRNTDTSTPLTVTISSDADDILSYDNTVIIPAGSASTVVKVIARENAVTEDKSISFSATAEGYSKGTLWAMVSDRTLPDARLSAITVDAEEAFPESDIVVKVTLKNTGADTLPEMIRTNIYLDGEIAASAYNQSAVAPGEEVVLTKTIKLPATLGNHTISANTNESKSVKELIYTNNASAMLSVKVISSYSAEVSTDKNSYMPGESVRVDGQLTGLYDAGETVEVYFINNGMRQSVKATADESGRFIAEFIPYEGQGGLFEVGACNPGDRKNDTMASFDLLNLRHGNYPITCDLMPNEPYTGKIVLSNLSASELTGLDISVDNEQDDCELTLGDVASTIGGGRNLEIGFTLVCSKATTGSDWKKINLTATTDCGLTVPVTIHYYCRTPLGNLTTEITTLSTTMTWGKTTEYPFVVTNTGHGETGKIHLNIPDWMKSATPLDIPSLQPGESTTVVLQFATNDNMKLNLPVTGTLGLSCENGNGVSLRYDVTPVTEETGFVTVEACDEYTYNTAEAPKVAGATVKIKNASTGAVLHQMITGEDGTCSLEMQAGYYRIEVTAEKHQEYSEYFYVNPGKNTVVTADISYNPITINWDVKETEVEDEYQIDTVIEYETNVPMPNVKVILPKSIDGDNMAVGDVTMITMTLVNVGLIQAQDVNLVIPTDPTEFKFEALAYTDPFVLNPGQSVNVPIRITRIADESLEDPGQVRRHQIGETMINTYRNCMTQAGTLYRVICGKRIKYNTAAENMAMKMCAASATMNAIGEILENVFRNGPILPTVPVPGPPTPGGGSGKIDDPITDFGDAEAKFTICDPCDAEIGERLIATLSGKSVLGKLWNAIDDAIKAYRSGGSNLRFVVRKVGEDMADYPMEAAKNFSPGLGKLYEFIVDVYEISKPCEDTSDGGPDDPIFARGRRAQSNHDWINEFQTIGRAAAEQMESILNVMSEILGDPVWFTEMDEEKQAFMNYILELTDDEIPSDEELQAHRPESVSMEQARAFADRILGITSPSIETVEKEFETFEKGEEFVAQYGRESLTEYLFDAYDDFKQRFEDMRNNSVCASVSLKISQKMTMTRQAFNGTLSIYNGHESKPMENVKLNLLVRDEFGNVATSHEFQINPGCIRGFTGDEGLTSGWQLAAGANGVAEVIFIPTRYAAPEKEVQYSFGGSVTYIDPFTGLEVSRNLNPVQLTVKPSPVLDMTYFVQRDIYGDNPLTPDVVESSVPAEFALVINNKGYGEASNVRMLTNQPEIIDNEKGLAIDFEFVSSQLNGSEKSLALGGSIATDFGDIPAQSSAYAQWWLKSSLLGHFIEYDVRATHLTSYDNPDLTLLDNVTIHELIHGFTPADRASGSSLRGFLVNDIPDSDDLPETIWFSDSREEEDVETAESAMMARTDENVFTLTVTPTASGNWHYAKAEDLAYGRKLVSAVRNSDGAEMPLDNFWQSEVTLVDGKKPVDEHSMHFIGRLSSTETFTLVFEPQPDVRLEVEKFSGLPSDDEIVTRQQTSVIVSFNKPVVASTFSNEDVSLMCEGEPVDCSSVNVTAISDVDYSLDLSQATLANGYYVLTVRTEGITDTEGFSGQNGKNVSWVQYIDGMATLTVVKSPADGGSVSPDGSALIEIGTEVEMTAEPSEGYEFSGWQHNGTTVSTEPNLKATISGNESYTALFALKRHNIEIVSDVVCGAVENAASGIYDYGTTLELFAIPADGYTFDSWTVNGENAGSDIRLIHIVKEDARIEPVFAVSSTTGVGSIDGTIRIEPVPMRDYVVVNGNYREAVLLVIYNVSGEAVFYGEHIAGGERIDVSNLAPGLYIVRAITDNGTFSREVVKK